MKKLPFFNKINNTCPKCSNPLKTNFEYKKARSLRIAFSIVLSLFIIFAIPRIVELITWNAPITNPGWWVALAITIGLGISWPILIIKIKKFENTPHHIAHCDHCKQTWLFP